MSALERDLIAWTKAKTRILAAVMSDVRDGAAEAELRKVLTASEIALFRRGMRLLRKEGK